MLKLALFTALILQLVYATAINNVFFDKEDLTPRPNSPSQITHHIKWITNHTFYPFRLSVSINDQDLNETTNYDWFKLSENKLVTHLPTLFKTYLVTESELKSNLYLLSYNNQTHEQLSSYEPKMVNHLNMNGVSQTNIIRDTKRARDVFTLAYLKSHSIKVNKPDNDTYKVRCIADFLISRSFGQDDAELMVPAIMAQMEKYASFKIAIKSSEIDANKINRNVYKNKRPKSKPEHDPRLFKIDQQQDHLFDHQHQQANLHQFYSALNNMASNMYPAHNNYQNGYFSMNFAANPIQNQAPLYRNNPNLWSFSPLIRTKRDNEHLRRISPEKDEDEADNGHEGGEEEKGKDYDVDKFYRIRLSLGPLMIHSPFGDEEQITCTLNLINKDDINLDYQATIEKKILTKERVEEVESTTTSATSTTTEETSEELIDRTEMKSFEPVEAKKKTKDEDKKEVLFFFDKPTTPASLVLDTIKGKAVAHSMRLNSAPALLSARLDVAIFGVLNFFIFFILF